LWLPRAFAQLVLPIAAASYHIYLFHRILPDLLLPQPDPMVLQPVTAALAVAAGMAVGLAVFALQKLILGALASRRIESSRTAAPQRA
jgi:hypothetical protein